MRLLVIEDSRVLRESLTEGLRHAGYAVDAAEDGQEGLWLLNGNPYDAVLLDLMLPGLDGMSVLQQLRADRQHCGVLVLTARDRPSDKIAGLRQGADDFLVKPFDFEELLARIEAVIRRRHGQPTPTLRVGPLTLDRAARTATLSGRPLELALREYNLLEYLMLRGGQIVSRTDIEAHLYDQNATLMSNVVDSTVCALRKKLAMPDGRQLIQTRRGMGYVIREPL